MRNYILLAIIFLTACHDAQTKKITFDFYPHVADSIREKYILPEIKEARFFNLPVIYKGVDSIEMRIRPWNVFGLGISLYVLKVDSMGWKGYHYDSYTLFHLTENGGHVTKRDSHNIGDSVFMVKEFTPLCGWENFIDSIKSFKLENLPTQSLIKNFKPVTGFVDGSGYNIEIATSHSYRILSYIMPEYSSYAECKTISKFIAFLKRQLGKDYDWPDYLYTTGK
jgi:hypothetical protein